MTNALIGYGIVVEMSTPAAPTTWIPIAEVYSASPPVDTYDQVEATHYLSPGRRREYITGLVDGGDIPLEMNYIPGSATDLFFLAIGSALRNVRITFGNGVVYTFQALLKSYAPSTPVDDRMTMTATMKVTGAVTQTAGAVPAVMAGLGPTIFGTLTNGSTLTLNPGSYFPAATSVSLQVRRGGTNTGAPIVVSYGSVGTYLLSAGDVGTGIDIVATPSNGVGAGATSTSPRTANIA